MSNRSGGSDDFKRLRLRQAFEDECEEHEKYKFVGEHGHVLLCVPGLLHGMADSGEAVIQATDDGGG